MRRFSTHENSNCEAAQKINFYQSGVNVSSSLDESKKKSMVLARDVLNVIFTSIEYAAQQGIALRGHDESESNFYQLLKTRSHESSAISSWIQRESKWLPPDIQKEILEMLSHDALRTVVDTIKENDYFFNYYG